MAVVELVPGEKLAIASRRTSAPGSASAVEIALPVFEGKLVSYYRPAAGFTARLGWEWSF